VLCINTAYGNMTYGRGGGGNCVELTTLSF
jgi:hypothetical protein